MSVVWYPASMICTSSSRWSPTSASFAVTFCHSHSPHNSAGFQPVDSQQASDYDYASWYLLSTTSSADFSHRERALSRVPCEVGHRLVVAGTQAGARKLHRRTRATVRFSLTFPSTVVLPLGGAPTQSWTPSRVLVLGLTATRSFNSVLPPTVDTSVDIQI